jgi:hypothetical protein
MLTKNKKTVIENFYVLFFGKITNEQALWDQFQYDLYIWSA